MKLQEKRFAVDRVTNTLTRLLFPRRSRCILIVLLFLCSNLSASDPNKYHSTTIRDLMSVRSVAQVKLSPDGRWVTYELRTTMLDENQRQSDLWLVDTGGQSQPVQLAGESCGRRAGRFPALHWLPDSKTISYLASEQGSYWIQLIRIDRQAEAIKGTCSKLDLAAPGPLRDFKWSPDAHSIGFIFTQRPEKASEDQPVRGLEANSSWHPREGDPRNDGGPRAKLAIVDIDTQVWRILTDEEFHLFDFDWSPSGQDIAFSASREPTWDSFMATDLYTVNLPTGKIRSLVKQPGWDSSPSWSPDGEWIAFTTGKGKVDWLYFSTIGVVPSAGGEPSYPGEDLWDKFGGGPGSPNWSADGEEIYFEAAYRMGTYLFSVSVADGQVHPITPINSQMYSRFSFSADHNVVAFATEDPATPPDIFISEIQPFQAIRLTDINPQFRQLAPPQIETIKWRSKDDKWDIHGVVVKPPDYRPGGKYPLLVVMSGGPSMVRQSFNLGSQHPTLVYAARGYVVLVPNTRGRNGFGGPFRRAIQEEKNYGPGPVQDALAGVDHLVTEGLVDPSRLGITGFSYGAYLTAYAITQTDRFKAASLIDGVTNIPYNAFQGAGDPSMAGIHRAILGFGSPFDPQEMEEMIRQSPVHNLSKAKTPTLLEFGIESMAWDHGRMLFQGLLSLGIPTEFIVYPRTGHGISEPLLLQDSMSRNLEWMDYWVLGIPTERMRRKWGQRALADQSN